MDNFNKFSEEGSFRLHIGHHDDNKGDGFFGDQKGDGEHGGEFKLFEEVNHEAMKAISEESPEKPKTELGPVPEPKSSKTEPLSESEKRPYWKTLLRQGAYSVLFLLVGFLVLNWGAYSKIVEQKYNQWFNKNAYQQEQNYYNDLAQVDGETGADNFLALGGDEDSSGSSGSSDSENLQGSENSSALQTSELASKTNIPKLDLEVTPYDNRLIIPRINENIPVVRISSEALVNRDWDRLEADMQEGLRHGVVHYPGTSLPGRGGNTVITGHSSYFPWDSGRFKDVFALLHDVVEGDRIIAYYDQDKYLYEIKEIKVVLPEDIEVLKQTPDERMTLITCTPIGTNLKRLIVIAEPIAVNGIPIEPDDSDDEKVGR